MTPSTDRVRRRPVRRWFRGRKRRRQVQTQPPRVQRVPIEEPKSRRLTAEEVDALQGQVTVHWEALGMSTTMDAEDFKLWWHVGDDMDRIVSDGLRRWIDEELADDAE